MYLPHRISVRIRRLYMWFLWKYEDKCYQYFKWVGWVLYVQLLKTNIGSIVIKPVKSKDKK